MRKKPSIFTIGHSTRSIDEFVKLLQIYDITEVIDVRSIPKSRHNPQFSAEVLKQSLKRARIRYNHLKKLGGLRHTKNDSLNSVGIILHSEGSRITWQRKNFRKGWKHS